MAGWREFTNIWKTVGEVDLRPIREDALREIQVVLIGSQGSGVESLAEQMRRDPARPAVQTLTPIILLDPQDSSVVQTSSLWGKDKNSPDFGYPYDAEDGREDATGSDTVARVARGGAYMIDAQGVRCACRSGFYADCRNVGRGFRVVSLGSRN